MYYFFLAGNYMMGNMTVNVPHIRPATVFCAAKQPPIQL